MEVRVLQFLGVLFRYIWVIIPIWLLFATIKFIPNNSVGIVEKRFGAKTLKKGFIALNGESGFQPDLLRGGIHFLVPFQYHVHIAPLVTISQGHIGYVFARDGEPLAPEQTLASNIKANDFQDVRAFLTDGGQRGPQRQILREGTYAINLAQFVIFTAEKIYSLSLSNEDEKLIESMGRIIAERDGYTAIIIRDNEDKVGIVTIHDGKSLPNGEIIAQIVGNDPNDNATYHNNFQNPDKFLTGGGMRGRQLQTLVEGTYYINRLFATVEKIEKTVIEVGTVGVVVSYTGTKGNDLSGVEYRHGELVDEGNRGVWAMPLLPGKYAFNTYAGKVEIVPTTNIILKWIHNEIGTHRYDENLTEVSLITKDAFEPTLPLSVVVHIDYQKAPLVIQRFGDVKKLVEQTLDPMVAAYFKNIGQNRTLIELLQQRSDIQNVAGKEMREKFANYNLELEEVLIGTPTAGENDHQIEMILNQLRDRQIALEKIDTYARQQSAAVKERELREAEAKAAQQGSLTSSEINITIQSNDGKANYQRATQEAETIRTLASAEAEKTARIGIAQAMATEQQVNAYGGPQYQVMQQVLSRLAEAVEKSGVDLVPRVVVGGGADGGTTQNLFQSLMVMLLSKEFGEDVTEAKTEENPAITKIRDDIMTSLADKGKNQPGAAAAKAE
jgi:uncharacterized membrane protein YqiK